jgi:hypothetical protein
MKASNPPQVKILAVSNVYCRLMNFVNAGDIEIGHTHHYDHGTLLASGSLKVEILDESDNVLSTKNFHAPDFIFIVKEQIHKLTALEDNTVVTCIHALRDIDDNLVDPDFLVQSAIIDETKDGNQEGFFTLAEAMLKYPRPLKTLTSGWDKK